MKVNVEALMRLAGEATSGPWTVDHDHHDQPRVIADGSKGHPVAVLPHHCVSSVERQANADARYIAACDPETVRALCEEVLRLRAALTKLAFTHSGLHADDCGAHGAGPDELLGLTTCWCGATDQRERVRAMLKGGDRG